MTYLSQEVALLSKSLFRGAGNWSMQTQEMGWFRVTGVRSI
jgi:hypothetical protein